MNEYCIKNGIVTDIRYGCQRGHEYDGWIHWMIHQEIIGFLFRDSRTRKSTRNKMNISFSFLISKQLFFQTTCFNFNFSNSIFSARKMHSRSTLAKVFVLWKYSEHESLLKFFPIRHTAGIVIYMYICVNDAMCHTIPKYSM